MTKDEKEAFKKRLQKSREVTKKLIEQRKPVDDIIRQRFTI